MWFWWTAGAEGGVKIMLGDEVERLFGAEWSLKFNETIVRRSMRCGIEM